MTMADASKNPQGQTALDLGDTTDTARDAFDETAYRNQMIAAGISIKDATDVAAKTAAARRSQPTRGAVSRPRVRGSDSQVKEQPPAGSFSPIGALLSGILPPAVKKTGERIAYAAEKATPAQKAKAGRAAVLSEQERKLLDKATTIASVPPTGEDMAFTHAVLCQVGLPRAKIEAREFMRQSGAAWINVQAGWLDEGRGPVQQPVPYGVMPRLALAWVSSYAKRHNTREIPIGDSAAEFLRLMLGEDTVAQGARHATLRKQMHALAACRLQLGFKGRTFNGQPVEQFDAWLSNRDAPQRPLWPGVMTLSEHYFNELQNSAVPLDNRALHALKGSALALDVYCWLAHRLHRIEGKGITLHWKSIREQFAQEYKGKDPDKDFKKEFLPVLRKVQAVYPVANVKQVTGGLLLIGSPPPIPKLPKGLK
ncbi:replication protein RepA [Xanthomonas citri]|uniref:replication protein RepA n=1 Tax=Xanthomonas citri TaxID=346 RepID=UPI00052FCB0B|nr:replication protein RepA [Xanthomonas citri]CEI18824.1 Plasmid replication protein RepA1 [Xanthomonas citri pv. citri]